jgi:hypothetical protein
MVKLTRKYNKSKKSKTMKKNIGGMNSSSKKSPISRSFKAITQSGILARPQTPDIYSSLLSLAERGESPLYQKISSSSSEYKDALPGGDTEEINKLFSKIKFEKAKSELGEKYKKNFPYKKEKESIENMLREKEEFRKEKSKIKTSLRGLKHKKSYSKSNYEIDPVLSMIFKNPESLKHVSKVFEKIDKQKKYPTLYSITTSKRSKNSGGTRKNKSHNRI